MADLLRLHSKSRSYELDLSTVANPTTVVRPPAEAERRTWRDAVASALEEPLGAKKLGDRDLSTSKVCVITDDWGRPTPAHEFIPELTSRLAQAGAADENISFVCAAGMHDPMTEADLARKLGDETVGRYRCSCHDAGDRENLAFVGITGNGTPVWVNRVVAEADFVLAVGRVYPHVCYGYEGGYKMICPGVSSFETIIRDHNMNFSANSNFGVVRGNASRQEADAIGKLVGIDFLVNVVVDFQQRPVRAFAGEADAVFRSCVDFGERHVWGTKLDEPADITVVASSEECDNTLEDNPIYHLALAMRVTRPDGCVIAVMDDAEEESGTVVEGQDLQGMSLSELLLLHERRTWRFSERQVQHYIKSVRGEYYRRRVMELHSQELCFVSDNFSRARLSRCRARHFTDVNEALQAALARIPDARIAVVPAGARTYPLVEYSFPSGEDQPDA
ncbi:MAG: lactate racemase domain-containing protein [Planctomycetota bacterium]|jgi:nickel-dependent lactate racemase